jgi:hypothetical protein
MRTLLVLSLFLANALSAVKKEPIYLPGEHPFSMLWKCNQRREFNKAKAVKVGQLINIWNTSDFFDPGTEYIVIHKDTTVVPNTGINSYSLTLKGTEKSTPAIQVTFKKDLGTISFAKESIENEKLSVIEKKLYKLKKEILSKYKLDQPIAIKSSKKDISNTYQLVKESEDENGTISTILEKEAFSFRKLQIREILKDTKKMNADNGKTNQHVYRLTYSYVPNWKTIPTLCAATIGTLASIYYQLSKK